MQISYEHFSFIPIHATSAGLYLKYQYIDTYLRYACDKKYVGQHTILSPGIRAGHSLRKRIAEVTDHRLARTSSRRQQHTDDRQTQRRCWTGSSPPHAAILRKDNKKERRWAVACFHYSATNSRDSFQFPKFRPFLKCSLDPSQCRCSLAFAYKVPLNWDRESNAGSVCTKSVLGVYGFCTGQPNPPTLGTQTQAYVTGPGSKTKTVSISSPFNRLPAKRYSFH